MKSSNAKACLGNGHAIWKGMEAHSEETVTAQDLVGSNNN